MDSQSEIMSHPSDGCSMSSNITRCTNVIVIIIITRPKPPYGRQGLAGSWARIQFPLVFAWPSLWDPLRHVLGSIGNIALCSLTSLLSSVGTNDWSLQGGPVRLQGDQ